MPDKRAETALPCAAATIRQGDSVIATGGGRRITGVVLAVNDVLVVIRETADFVVHARYDFGLGAWTVGGKRVEIRRKAQ